MSQPNVECETKTVKTTLYTSMGIYVYMYIHEHLCMYVYYYSEETTYCVVFEMVAHTKICTNAKAALLDVCGRKARKKEGKKRIRMGTLE